MEGELLLHWQLLPGQAAQFLTITNILQAGENFVFLLICTEVLFNQFKGFKRLELEARFADLDNPDSFRQYIDDKTKGFGIETIGNPKTEYSRLLKNLRFVKEYDLPLIVDNTFCCCWLLFNTLEHGANIVVEAGFQWIGGFGTNIGGNSGQRKLLTGAMVNFLSFQKNHQVYLV